MKKLFPILVVLFTLVLATSVWSAGVIKTFNLKLYDASNSYTGVGDDASGTTTTYNTNFNAGAAISSVSEFTYCGGPGNRTAIANTSDNRTFDLNNYIEDFSSGFDIVFTPAVDETDPTNSGVTVSRSYNLLGTGPSSGAWMVGVKFSPIDAVDAWAAAKIYWAGPLDQTLASTDTINYDDRGGVTGIPLTGASTYAYAVRGHAEWIGGKSSTGGASTFVVHDIPISRYMRPVFASASTPFRNAEYWMSLVPKVN